MKFLALLALLILSACAPADPYQARAAADARIQGTQRAVNQAKAQQVEQRQATEVAAMSTQGAAEIEISLLQAQAQATVQAINNGQAQLDAALLAGQATRAAWEYALAMRGTEQAARATATGVGLEMENARRSAVREEAAARRLLLVKLVGLWVVVIGIGVGLVIGLIYLWRWLDWKIAWTDRKNLIFHSPDGTIFVDYSSGQAKAMLVREIDYYRTRRRLDGPRGDALPVQDVQWISPSVASSPMPQTASLPDELNAALEVVEASIEYYGTSDAEKIPRYNIINMTPNRWELGTDFLVGQGMIEKSQGKPTVTRMKLRDILYRLQHSPTPG